MEASYQHFQDQNKGLGFEPLNYTNGDQSLDVSSVMNADVLSQEVQNLALKDSINGKERPMESKDAKPRKHFYPLRPQADNCKFFMRYGKCRFGSNCKYNHPLDRRSQYSVKPEGCKHKEACKNNQSGRKTVVAPVLQFNFLGLPIRPGEKECPQYRQKSSCKYGLNCWFDHPEPLSMGGGFPLSGYTDFEGTMPCWSVGGPIYEIGPFEASHMYQPAQCAPYSEWIEYQVPLEHQKAPIYTTSGKSQSTHPAITINTPVSEAKSYPQHQQRVLVKEYSKPNVQPESNFKFGFGSHHPKTSSCPLNDKGLPLRPDMEVCTFFDLYGVCKYGPACKFDHPITLGKSVPAGGSDEEVQLSQLPDPATEELPDPDKN